MKKDRLGRGLGALLGEYMPEGEAPPDGEVKRIPLEASVPTPLQPRQEFSEEELSELVASIRENGTERVCAASPPM